MTGDSLFDRPPADWSDEEIRVGLTQLGRRVTELRDTANRLLEVAAALADERDRRAAVYAEMTDAMSGGGPGRWLRGPSTRRAERRRRRSQLD